MKIELFTEVNFRGPTAKNGKCIALVECETKKGPAVKAQIETEQNTTYHRMSMIAILVGLRMLRPCEVTVYTPDQFLVTTINEGNMDKWKKNYKKKYGANPPFEVDKRKQRRYARKMARQINITLPTMMETLTKEIDGWVKSLKSALITMCESMAITLNGIAGHLREEREEKIK